MPIATYGRVLFAQLFATWESEKQSLRAHGSGPAPGAGERTIARPARARYAPAVKAIILSIGHELTTGQTVDTNAAWLAAELTLAGWHVAAHVTIDDEIEPIARAFRDAMSAAELIIATGGLGPTADDLTRDGLAAALGVALVENPAALQEIESFFARVNRPMHPANRRQALMPNGCHPIPNDWGTAPGISHESGAIRVFCLPGVPREMRNMFAASVQPALRRAAPQRVTQTRVLRCFGMAEARIGELIEDLMRRGRNPTVGTTAAGAIIGVRITATAASESDVADLLDADAAEVRQRLGTAVFGEGDEALEHAVARLLFEQRLTVATAESCTGGLLAKRLTDIPGSSAYFLRGYVTYSNQAKTELLGVPPGLMARHGAVSTEVAEAMAVGCRTLAGVDYALAITGVAGPGGGTAEKPIGLVHVALAARDGVGSHRLLLGGHLARAEVRDRAVKSALNLLRLRLLGVEPA